MRSALALMEAAICNHFRADPSKLSTWAEYIGAHLPEPELQAASEDVWPRKPAIVARSSEGQTVVDQMIWGVPRKMPGKRPGTTITKHITNVRNLDSPFWRSMIATPAQRCLVPFTQFAEPKIGQGREEWWFTINQQPVSCFAGIWRPSEAGIVFAFLTCEPNPLVAPLHPKAMPVILHPEDYQVWLTGDLDAARALAQPFPSQLMAVA
ncbi:SOS response-associated peptidase [Sphingobium sp. B8D3B]|uniref:SOS response-associated peptidase n=2 Tax=unclassified Sphingobium TaxID=2611147 RepID=UPI002223FEAF|nr:SOS response-associated peptidase [Sphingobium sp. B8D3B]MCW2396150.1 putative SOS response-associated peptidase YedK [Sphingobium sp. B8D3B]MCW2419666.1 putative SOS response-associated peptidase YedK [Sphingobium sp. B8D3C]